MNADEAQPASCRWSCPILGFALATMVAPPVLAGGPPAIAMIDRTLWPYPLATARDFDRASLAENLVFAEVFLHQTQALDEGKLALPVRHVNKASLAHWRLQAASRLVRNLNEAGRGCAMEPLFALATPLSEGNLAAAVAGKTPLLQQRMPRWFRAARAFYVVYVAEQMRLAALFPAPTSEILTLTDRESSGWELPDKTFLLTFDDGPTKVGGETDKLAGLLRDRGVSAEFFVMHGPLSRRLARHGSVETTALYHRHCVGIHGKEHKPNLTVAAWQKTLTEMRALVASVGDAHRGALAFRPPYGQRSRELTSFVEDSGGTVVLWNIDSQDWHRALPAAAVGDRVLTLMLLWRRGIILFHDTHAKAGAALPRLLDAATKTGVTWQRCRDLLVPAGPAVPP